MSKCPTCFEWLPPVPSKFVCTGPCAPGRSELATAARGFDVHIRPVMDAHVPRTGGPAAAACPQCRTQTVQEVCPRCLGEIAPNWRAAKVTCIAMAGARATGKSLMLGVAKGQLELLVERHHRSALRAVGDTEALFYERYTRPLYEQRQILQPTPTLLDSESTSRDCLVFGFAETIADGSKRNRFLVLRDVAGEDLEAAGDGPSLSFFSRADAVVALVDPLKVPSIRHMLADLVPSDARLGGDSSTVLARVLSLMTNGVVGAKTQIPLAVVLSKFDTLQQLREVSGTEWARIMNRPGSPLQRDPSMRAATFDARDGDLLHYEVRALLGKLNSDSLTAMIEESAQRFRYFAVSALGAHPKGDSLYAGGIAPFRVLDPFKWAMQVSA